ncbi:hypothetical protein SAMN04487916_10447 [Arthrobacter sp. ov407]|uniref:hypothetical protein n=1 Tax=Arthrobacter sp. ov407 TaxID=1761748 RepID=UPI00088ED9FD|nr:hypothetical protein [Arthrobacter sp. ov407]SDK90659.1 hypothetical protein SAMN04487916_10447 [Arthrobacter sp. ov407]
MAFRLKDRDRRPAIFASVGALVLAASISGCSSTTGGEPPCLPPAYSLTPTEAKPGLSVTVAAPDADCNPRYGKNARIQVSVTDATGVEVVNTTSAMNDAGGFTYTFVVPAGTAVGEAAVTAMPYNIDWCDDTGRNNRVARARDVPFVRVSCAVPVKPLTITH